MKYLITYQKSFLLKVASRVEVDFWGNIGSRLGSRVFGVGRGVRRSLSAQTTAAMDEHAGDSEFDAARSPGRSEGRVASLQAGEERNCEVYVDVGERRQERVGARGRGWRNISERGRMKGTTRLWMCGLVVVSPSPRT